MEKKANPVLRSEGYNGLHHDLLNLLSLSSVRHSSTQYPDSFRYCKMICNSYWRGNENLTLYAAVSMAAQFRKQNDANQMKC